MKSYDFLSEAIDATTKGNVINTIILRDVVIYECKEAIKILKNDKIIYKYKGLTLSLNRDMSERAIL